MSNGAKKLVYTKWQGLLTDPHALINIDAHYDVVSEVRKINCCWGVIDSAERNTFIEPAIASYTHYV